MNSNHTLDSGGDPRRAKALSSTLSQKARSFTQILTRRRLRGCCINLPCRGDVPRARHELGDLGCHVSVHLKATGVGMVFDVGVSGTAPIALQLTVAVRPVIPPTRPGDLAASRHRSYCLESYPIPLIWFLQVFCRLQDNHKDRTSGKRRLWFHRAERVRVFGGTTLKGVCEGSLWVLRRATLRSPLRKLRNSSPV